MEYLPELFFVHSDFSLTPLSNNDFHQKTKKFYYIYIDVNSVSILKKLIELPYLHVQVSLMDYAIPKQERLLAPVYTVYLSILGKAAFRNVIDRCSLIKAKLFSFFLCRTILVRMFLPFIGKESSVCSCRL